MAAAAALLAIVGLGFLLARGGSDTSVDLASTQNAPLVPVLGSSDGPGNGDPSDSAGGDATSDGNTTDEVDNSDNANPDSSTSTRTSETAPVAPEPEPIDDERVIPEFDAAPGAVGSADFLPLDQGLPSDATFLATWNERSLSWYAVPDKSRDCNDSRRSQIRYVNGSGITQDVRQPQLYFSGEISHFTVDNSEQLATWLVSCAFQTEMYVATLDDQGRILKADLVWLGEATVPSARVVLDDGVATVNAIDPDGEPFYIDYDLATKLPSRNGGPSRIMIEAGAPVERDMIPLAASTDGSTTYWAGSAPAGSPSDCAANDGTNDADALWLRLGEGQWQTALADDMPLGALTSMAIDSEANQVAFGDFCENEAGRVYVGTQRADGLLSNLRTVDLSPFVPGYASQLFWVDSQTLLIETDNSEYGFGIVRFEFSFEDGQDQGIITQLDG